MTYYTWLDTPAGELLVIGDGRVVTGMYWKVFKRLPAISTEWVMKPEIFTGVAQQLQEYFAGARHDFDFTYDLQGTTFQKQVWDELRKIPYGAKTSYRAIADAIGKPKAVRAVGTAVGSNPIMIAVPCHRVLTTVDTLGGYAGGLPSKQLLLQTEGITFVG